MTQEDGNFTYIVLKLQGEYNLAYYGMIFLLCLFSLFVVYSVFSISVSKRTSEYGMLQTLGICESQIGRTLILELWMLFIIGYPSGCLLGNGILRLAYQKLNGVFGGKGVSTVTQQLSVADQTLAEGTKAAEYFCAWEAVWAGFVFLLFSLAAVGLAVIRSMRRKSLKEAMSGDMSYAKKRKIYALRDVNMARIVVRKFMFSNKKKVIAILLSLSVGGCIFLCTTYMIENLKVHAELSLQSDDGLGFDYKWDMGWMNDTLDYFRTDPQYRSTDYHKLTFSMMYYYDDQFLLPLSHDEVVHGKATILQKMNGDYEAKFPQARAFYMYMYAHPGKKLNFMGNEIGHFREWDEKREQDWNLLDFPAHQSFHKFMMDLNHIYLQHPAFYEKDYKTDGFEWLDCHGEDECVYAFARSGKKERLIAAFNFSDQAQADYTLKIPAAKSLRPLLNSDWEEYGGSTKKSAQPLELKNTEISLSLKPFTAAFYLAV